MKNQKYPTWLRALPFVGGCMAMGFLGSFLGGAWKSQPWYDESPKPPLWPPQWVFPTVWVGNYTLMGTALFQVWQRQKSRPIARPLAVFGLHLLHNVSFIPIIYRLKRKSVYVMMDTIALCSGFVTTLLFARVSRRAGWLMLPYLGWLGFTTFLKAAWWRMNANHSRNAE